MCSFGDEQIVSEIPNGNMTTAQVLTATPSLVNSVGHQMTNGAGDIPGPMTNRQWTSSEVTGICGSTVSGS